MNGSKETNMICIDKGRQVTRYEFLLNKTKLKMFLDSKL